VSDDSTIDLGRNLRPGPGGDPVRYRRILSTVEDALFGRDREGPVRIGRYELKERLGEGGLGVVYRAFDPKLHRDVAIKLLRLDLPLDEPDPGAAGLLLHEARAIAQLSHPNVVAVHDIGPVDLGALAPAAGPGEGLFIVMELVEGQTLRQWLEPGRSWQEIVDVFIDAGRGLAAAHARDIVHRDFKPSNLMVGSDGRPRVLDFGVALRSGTSDGALEASTVTGTPAYMAPEQHVGEPGDARSDQFAFCVSLYEALVGRRPFEGASFEAYEVAKREGADVPRDVMPRRVQRAIARGLSASPADRFADMGELLRELQSSRRRLWIPAAAAVGAAVAFVAGGLLTRQPTEDPLDCSVDADTLIAEAVPAASVEDIRRVFGGIDRPFAASSLPIVDSRIADYGRTWILQRTKACEEPDPDSRVLGCLESRRQSLAALVEVLRAADADVALRSIDAVDALPSLVSCSEDPEPLVDPATRDTLATASAHQAAGRLQDAVDLIGRAIAERETRGQNAAPELLLSLGVAQHMWGHLDEAAKALAEAEAAAEASGDTRVAVAAQIRRASVDIDRGRLEDAEKTFEIAQARTRRIGSPTDLARGLAWHRARLEFDRGNMARTLELLEQAAAMGAGPERDVRLFRAITTGVFADAKLGERMLRELLADEIARLGPDHPSHGLIWVDLGAVLLEQGRWEEAAEASRRGAAMYELTHPASHVILLTCRLNPFTATRHRSDALDSLVVTHDVLEAAEQSQSDESPILTHGLLNVAEASLALGRPTTALEAGKRAASVRERAAGRPDIETVRAHLVVAEAAYVLGREDEAREAMEAAKQNLGGLPEDLGLARRAVALARLARLETDAAARGALLTSAEQQLEAAPPVDAAGRVEAIAEIALAWHGRGSAEERMQVAERLDERRSGIVGFLHGPRVHLMRADAARARGDREAARGSAQRALDEAQDAQHVLAAESRIAVASLITQSRARATLIREARTTFDRLDTEEVVRRRLFARWNRQR
jgi:serine/threonine protein kinase